MKAAFAAVGLTAAGGAALLAPTLRGGARHLVENAFANEISDLTSEYGQLRASFYAVSDTHISLDIPEYTDRLANMFDDIASSGTAFDTIVVNGDITNGGLEEQYALFAETAQDAGFSYPDDFTLVMGNHEQSPYNEGDAEEYARLRRTFIEQTQVSGLYYDFYLNGCHIIVLGPDEDPEGSWVSVRISDEQLAWLDGLLAADEAADVVSYVFMHEPLLNTVRDTNEGQWGYENSIENDAEVAAVLQAYASAIVFSGHTHSYPDIVRPSDEGPLYVGTGSVSYQVALEEGVSSERAYDSMGWFVRVYDGCVQFELRDFLSHAWVEDASFIYEL